jgi:chemotaxis protein CheD
MPAEAAGALASRHYYDRDFDRMAVKLLPSEYYVTAQPTALLTVLGSCVAACLHDPHAGVAGMNHFMLPDEGEGGRSHPDAMRYGAHAMDVLVSELLKAGARRERLQAKVFGGAAVLAGMTSLNIGDRNADFVRRYLRDAKIDLFASDLGGQHARRVCFLPDTGRVVVRKLRRSEEVDAVQVEERRLLRQLSAPRVRAVAP